MKPCEIRKNGRRTQRYGVSNVRMEELSRDLAATGLLKQYPAIHTNYSV